MLQHPLAPHSFELDAESEHLADLAGLHPNPWAGAGKRVEIARAEAAKQAEESLDAATRENAAKLATAYREYAELHERLADRTAEAEKLDKEFAKMSEARRRNAAYATWLRSPQGLDEELGRRSGEMSRTHFLANVTATQRSEMLRARDLEHTTANIANQINALHGSIASLRAQFPQLASAEVK